MTDDCKLRYFKAVDSLWAVVPDEYSAIGGTYEL